MHHMSVVTKRGLGHEEPQKTGHDYQHKHTPLRLSRVGTSNLGPPDVARNCSVQGQAL